MNRRDSDYCPACDRPWDECKCPRLERLNGGVVAAEPKWPDWTAAGSVVTARFGIPKPEPMSPLEDLVIRNVVYSWEHYL